MLPERTDISIVIVEDHSIFIEGLCTVFQNIEGVHVTGTFMEGRPAVEFIRDNKVDVVFLDISLPDISGIEVCKAIKAIDPDIKVIALSNHTEKSVITDILQQGANGYLLKNTSRKDLINAIYQVLDDQLTMNGEVQGILFSPSAPKAELPRLTKREIEILKLVSEGATTSVIAAKLFISPQTVETHRKNLMQKFKVNNSASLIRKAIENKIIS